MFILKTRRLSVDVFSFGHICIIVVDCCCNGTYIIVMLQYYILWHISLINQTYLSSLTLREGIFILFTYFIIILQAERPIDNNHKQNLRQINELRCRLKVYDHFIFPPANRPNMIVSGAGLTQNMSRCELYFTIYI